MTNKYRQPVTLNQCRLRVKWPFPPCIHTYAKLVVYRVFLCFRMNCRVRVILTVMAVGGIPYVILVHMAHSRFRAFNINIAIQKLLLPMPSSSANNQQLQQPILTMFTTFKNSSNKMIIYENTIRLWHRLWPEVVPILFTALDPLDPESLAHYAVEQGWYVLPVPKTSPTGVPVLRHMFLEAQNQFNTTFYCYANGDILFDRNLTDTIRFLEFSLRGKRLIKLLVVGRRMNWSMKNTSLTELDEVGHYANSSTLFNTNAQDYFLTTRDGYPWRSIPDFVVGRVGYDNWLVVTALVKHILVLDATATVTALHQTGEDGNLAGHGAQSERYYNYGLAKGFNYDRGLTTCGQFATQRKNGTIVITERTTVNGKRCSERGVPFVKNPFVWWWQCYSCRNISISHLILWSCTHFHIGMNDWNFADFILWLQLFFNLVVNSNPFVPYSLAENE